MLDIKILDLDNTLLNTSPGYRMQNQEFASYVQARIPALSIPTILARFDDINSATGERLGVLQELYPQAMVEALRVLSDEHGVAVTRGDEAAVFDIGMGVYDWPCEPLPGAIETVRAYRTAGVRLGLLTKGDPRVQYPRKIDRYGLRELFHAIEVVRFKTPSSLAAVIARLDPSERVPRNRVVMIGDSMADDITCANALDIPSVLIVSGDPGSWAYDRKSTAKPTYTLRAVHDLPSVFPTIGGKPILVAPAA